MNIKYFLCVLFASYSYCYMEYLMYDEIWPPSILNNNVNNNTSFNNTYFVINNLRAVNINGLSIIFCSDIPPFDISEISSLLPQLDIYWTNYKTPIEYHLKYLYYKYFSCIKYKNIYNEIQYFKTGLMWRESDNLYNILKLNNITPSDHISYSTNDLAFAIYYSVGVLPIIECNEAGMLYKISFCINRDLQYIFCPVDLYKKLRCKQIKINYGLFKKA